MVRALVIPKMCWAAAWQRPTKKAISRLTCAIERAVVPRMPPGRSRYIAWAAQIGPDLNPEYCLHMGALRVERWRCKRRVMGQQV
eukprot:8742699-Karenia_brevis.AAC.1